MYVVFGGVKKRRTGGKKKGKLKFVGSKDRALLRKSKRASQKKPGSGRELGLVEGKNYGWGGFQVTILGGVFVVVVNVYVILGKLRVLKIGGGPGEGALLMGLAKS